MDDLLADFIAETRETLEALSGEIVAWEASPDDRGRLDAIFRFVHTVKGSCGFLRLPRLQRLSHAAEDVLADVRAGKRAPDRALVNAVLAVVDRIAVLAEALDARSVLPEDGEDALIAALAMGTPEMAQSTPAAPRAHARTVRLGVDLLDRMMSGMSDMVLARNELARVLREGTTNPAVEAALARLSVSVVDMRETVTRARMQRIETLFAALPRMVRDTAAALGKTVVLTLEGSDVEIDREMVEVMRDPLIHMVRNAIDHGIESAAERVAAGKPEAGHLIVAARQAGNQIVLEVCDDGRGIDIDRLADKLAASGTQCEPQSRDAGAARGAELIFQAGLSVRDAATAISGRGVGMDVVRAAVEQIGGRIELDNRPGRGLRIEIRAPLMLSIIPAILVGVGNQRFAVPRQIVEEIVAGPRARVRVQPGQVLGTAQVRARHMPLVDLATLLEIESARAEPPMLIVIGLPSGCFALAVDTVLDHQELVVKPASSPVMAAGVYAGMTLPDSGQPVLLLDCACIASVAGVRLDRSEEPDATVPASDDGPAREGAPGLVFVDLDGARRVVPLAAVDRIERAPAEAIRMGDGGLHLARNGKAVPVESVAPIESRSEVTILRLTDGHTELAYAVRDAANIVQLPDAIEPAAVVGRIAGTVLLDQQPTELIDVEWLLGQVRPAVAGRASGPLCLLAAPAFGPLAAFVGPLLEQHGYRVVLGRASWEPPAVVLAPEAAGRAGPIAERLADAPVIRLRSRQEPDGPGDPTIYRYDSGALLAAVAERIGVIGAVQ
jgi:two-component system chemotaxis sensor kinase CheA